MKYCTFWEFWIMSARSEAAGPRLARLEKLCKHVTQLLVCSPMKGTSGFEGQVQKARFGDLEEHCRMVVRPNYGYVFRHIRLYGMGFNGATWARWAVCSTTLKRALQTCNIVVR